MNDEEELDAFLEHHGIKGMRWGIRNKSKKAPLSRKERADRKKRIIRRAHNLTKVAIATWFITATLASLGDTRHSRTRSNSKSAQRFITQSIKKNGSIKVGDINRINNHITLNSNTSDWFANLINDKIKEL